MNDLMLGYIVLNKFLSIFNSMYGFNYTPDDIASANSAFPGTDKIFIEGLGMQYREVIAMDSDKLDASMRALSQNSDGQIPALKSFSYAFVQAAQNNNFWEATKFVAVNSASQILDGAAAVGNAVIDSGKLVVWLLPIGVVAFIYFYGKNTLSRIS